VRDAGVTDLTLGSVTQLAQRIRDGEVSAVDVVDAHLARIDEVDPHLHGIVARSPRALDDARAADDARRRGLRLGPLHGVPFTVKDWIETEGLVCAAGFETRRHFVPRRDATTVARLKAAGAILLGKTKPGSAADLHPAPRNPYDLTRSPGGSSSGEAALIAACASPLGLGSDSGGSIRWPAHCCGIAAIRPTTGLLPNTGHFPPVAPLADPRTVIGPMARRVEDLAYVLPLLAGVDGRDPGVIPMPVGNPGSVKAARLAVATFAEFPGATPQPAVRDAVAVAAAALAEAGARIVAQTPPRIEEALAITRDYWARPESISLSNWRPTKVSALTANDVARSLFEWDRLRRSCLSFMTEVDLIVCPVACEAAPARQASVEEDYIYLLPWSLTGYPCVVVRAGTTAEDLPVGVQIIARPWHDHVALAAAAIVERTTGGWQPPRL
jgi:amidase